MALNRALALLDQIGLNPEAGDIQANIYSGAVPNIVTKALAEVSNFVQNKDTAHPGLYNPALETRDRDWGLELKATSRPGKGAESHNPAKGWFMVIVYKVIDGQTHIIQVETAPLAIEDWTIHERAAESERTRTAVTEADATRRLRESSIYLDPNHVPARIRQVKEAKGQPYLF